MDQVPIIRLDPSGNVENAIGRAAEILISGGLVAYPTESFYGLAVDATNEEAIKRLFSAKKRSTDMPILILIPETEILGQYTEHIPAVAHRLISEFWPGGLTMVFESGPKVSPLLTAGTHKIGIRLSSHPVATALTRAIGVPISGTSANISGQPACRNAGEILHSFGNDVGLILDGGESTSIVGSTVLDVTLHPPRVLREGMVRRSDLEKFDLCG